jgi:hypothetical protein
MDNHIQKENTNMIGKLSSRWYTVMCVMVLFALSAMPALAQPIVRAAPVPMAEIEFRGTLDAMEGISPILMLKVSGHLVITQKETSFQGQLMVGAVVQVSGFQRSDGSVLAARITVETKLERVIRFRARIVSLPDDPNWLGKWQVGNYSIIVKETTTIDTSGGKPQVGMLARSPLFANPMPHCSPFTS